MGDPIPPATRSTNETKETILEITAVGSVAVGTIFQQGKPSFPAYQGSAYQGGTSDPYAGNGASVPNADFRLKWTPNQEWTVTLGVTAGPNSIPLQAAGIQHKQPIDVPQLDVQWCRSFFCVGAGRWMDPTISTDLRKTPLYTPLFSLSPFTFTEGKLGLRGEFAKLWFGVSPGPDRIVDNNNFPFFRTTVEWEKKWDKDQNIFSGSVNWFGGPEQDNNKDFWKHRFDTTITYETPSVKAFAYVQAGFEQKALKNWQKWAGGDLNLFVRPPQSKVGGYVRVGYIYDEGALSQRPEGISILQVTGGLSLYPTDFIEIRAHADLLTTLNGQNNLTTVTDEKQNPILELAGVSIGRNIIPRAMIQILVYYTWKKERVVKPEGKNNNS